MNKKSIFILTTFIMMLTIIACEQEIIENDLSYEEKLVVRSLLIAGNPIEVYFAKTLPLNMPYNPDAAYLDNVFAYIKRGNQIDTLNYITNGIYRTNNLNAQNGEEYELFAEWGNKIAYAKTIVPFSTTFQNGRLIETTVDGESVYLIEGLLTPRPAAVYGATWSIINNQSNYILEDSVITLLQRESDRDLQNRITIRTRSIPTRLVEEWRGSFFIRVHAFDEEFYNFFITQDANNATNNIFSQSGINLRWNVQGDGIGMFIGKSDYLIKIP